MGVRFASHRSQDPSPRPHRCPAVTAGVDDTVQQRARCRCCAEPPRRGAGKAYWSGGRRAGPRGVERRFEPFFARKRTSQNLLVVGLGDSLDERYSRRSVAASSSLGHRSMSVAPSTSTRSAPSSRRVDHAAEARLPADGKLPADRLYPQPPRDAGHRVVEWRPTVHLVEEHRRGTRYGRPDARPSRSAAEHRAPHEYDHAPSRTRGERAPRRDRCGPGYRSGR